MMTVSRLTGAPSGHGGKSTLRNYGNPEASSASVASIGFMKPTITIKPFDPSTLKVIEKAIQTSDLGLNPNNDGKVIHLNLPPLNEERRRDLVKHVHHRLEESRIAVRNVRRDSLNDMRDFEKEKLITEMLLKVVKRTSNSRSFIRDRPARKKQRNQFMEGSVPVTGSIRAFGKILDMKHSDLVF